MSYRREGWPNNAVHRRTACEGFEVENQSAVLGDGPRYPTGMMTTRHLDDGTSIHDFTGRFLVRCPKCESCATVTRIESDTPTHPWSARFCCAACGSTKDGTLGGWSDRDPVDWVFGHALWLQTPCCGHTLWAYNFKHLAFLESYISAEHRVGLPDAKARELGIRNTTLASSLPEWMIRRKHRDDVLRSIRRLRSQHCG